MVLFIMKLLVQIQVPIHRSKDILITTSIWINGTQGKNNVSSQKWATVACIYPWEKPDTWISQLQQNSTKPNGKALTYGLVS
jgi:hypothetical protein